MTQISLLISCALCISEERDRREEKEKERSLQKREIVYFCSSRSVRDGEIALFSKNMNDSPFYVAFANRQRERERERERKRLRSIDSNL
jgi:hypothetical protein